MMLALGPIALLCIAAGIYLLAFLNQPYLFILVLPWALMASVLLGFLTVSEIAWHLVPRITRRPIERRKRRFTAIVAGGLTLVTAVAWLINVYLLPDRLHVVSLLGNAMIFGYTWIFGWRLLQKQRARTMVPMTVAFCLALALLSLLGRITVSDGETERMQELTSLPYVGWSEPDTTIRGSGVTTFKKKHAFHGLNLYPNDVSKVVVLMDMSGEVLHTWDYGHLVSEKSFPLAVELCRNGDLLVSAADRVLAKLDWESNVVWRVDARVHHDIAIAANGDVLTLARKDQLKLIRGVPVPVLNDYILVLSPDGARTMEIPLVELFDNKIGLDAIRRSYRWAVRPGTTRETIERQKRYGFALEQTTPADLLHTNAIEIIDRDVEGVCRKGNLLLSFRDRDLIGILDLGSRELVWTWGRGELSRQHQPTLLENGNILVFDNGLGKGASRVVEIDPLARQIVWTYEAFPAGDFYSKRMGSSQRLPGGNTLITNSESGHVFEMSNEHGLVWEYYNPEVGERGDTRGIIYRMRRIKDRGAYAFPEGLTQ